MPGIVKVRVIAARDLPIMDRSSELTDAFVELRLGEGYHKTRVCPKTLDPVWNSPWFTFTVNDEDLQDEPLQIKLLDYDIYTAHDAIGRVYIQLGCLTGQEANSMDGWFPIFDTLHGIRGEVRLVIKVEMLRDQHRLKQSSCEVAFFACPQVPSCYTVLTVPGFVEELVVNDDPEYQWIDKIRTPRASNEARQRLFSRLSGELKRKIGLKTLELGGNAVMGYKQCFDLEGESGIVVRGIGTSVFLVPTASSSEPANQPVLVTQSSEHETMLSPQHHKEASLSDSDGPQTPTKLSLAAAAELALGTPGSSGNVAPTPSKHQVLLSSEFPFYTLNTLPSGMLVSLGGLVTAHSVKLLDKIENPDETDTRNSWWEELRIEVRQHIRAMACNAVLSYTESTSICDNLCVLSACGTAVCVSNTAATKRGSACASPGGETVGLAEPDYSESSLCAMCHIPYSVDRLPFEVKLSKCHVCRSKYVPSVVLSSGEIPSGLAIRGRGTLIQATAVHYKKKLKGGENAQEVGKALPFLEHTLHERILHKLRLRGMNALFKYKLLLNVGDSLILATAVGTGVYVEALPGAPSLFVIRDEAGVPDDYQSILSRTQQDNKALFGLETSELQGAVKTAESAEPEGILESGSSLLIPVTENIKPDQVPHLFTDCSATPGFYLGSTVEVPGVKATPSGTKMVTMVRKEVWDSFRHDSHFSLFFHRLLQGLMFRVRHMTPCALANISYDIDLPEDNELQVAVTAVVCNLRDSKPLAKSQSDELIFTMDQASSDQQPTKKEQPIKREEVVLTTSLLSLPGYRTEKYFGIVNLFLIRESTSMREGNRANSFMHLFMLEALSIARAHVAALGGNALLSYQLKEVVFIEHPQKNQAQCLLNLSGDAALVRPAAPVGEIKPSPQHKALDSMDLLEMPEHQTITQPNYRVTSL